MKKLILQLIFGFVVLPASIVGTLFYLNKTGFFNISKVEVKLEGVAEGQEHFLKPQLQALESELSKYQGRSLWNIKIKQISREVIAHKWVDSLTLKRSWPARLNSRAPKPVMISVAKVWGGGTGDAAGDIKEVHQPI